MSRPPPVTIAVLPCKFTVTATTLAAGVAQAKDLRGWNIHVVDYPVSHGMEQFLADVTEMTGGDIKGKIFHGGVLGSQPDAIEQVRLGALDFGVFSLGPMGQVVPETNVVSLPFIFKGIDQMYRLMDGEVGEAIGKGLEAKGIVALGWYDAGARSFYNSQKPINTPDDVQQAIVKMAGRVSALKQRELWQAREMASMETVESGGTTVNKIADKGPFQAAMASVYDKFLEDNPDLTDLVDMIRNAD